MGAKKKHFEKGEFVFLNGYQTNSIGIVLTGRAQVIKEDIFGNRAILNDLRPKAVFGESFVCGGNYALTVSIQAAVSSDILLLPFDRIMNICPSACGFHNTLIKNMVEMVSRKNIKLMETLEITTKRSLREKVLTYLYQLAREQDSLTVTSPLGRVDLAGFLGADRSALTRELGRMRNDGLIQFEKNTYTLKNVHKKA
ncbi:Crp/Fnr family transcriptional regulator [Tyzzerella sp. OttesenSCG-928-J15]|nr:Crp/Fnr family transcriptional regulator [Tyzzerella sp. OttesenSCG-928-J15]